MDAAALCANLSAAVDAAVEKHITISPCYVNRASSLGHPCARFLTYCRTAWDKRARHSLTLQYIFEEGNLHEPAVIRRIQDAGFVVIEQQRTIGWPDKEITGHIDGALLVDGEAIPMEIKSASPNSWEEINHQDDLLRSERPWLRNYLGQLTIYCLMYGKEQAVLVLKNKTTGRLKFIPYTMDYAFGEEIIQKAEAVNAAVKAGTLPDRMPYEPEVCEECAFHHLCMPPKVNAAIEFDEGKLEAILDELEACKGLAVGHEKRIKELESLKKQMVDGKPKILAGHWLVTGKVVEIPEKAVKGYSYWRSTVKRLGVSE